MSVPQGEKASKLVRIFVYCNDDVYHDNATELLAFNTKAEAVSGILKRISQYTSRTVDMYSVIEGRELTLRATKIVQGIEIP